MALKDVWVDKVDSPTYNHSAEDVNLVAKELIATQESRYTKAEVDEIITNAING